MSSKQSKLASWQQLVADASEVVEPQVNKKEIVDDLPVEPIVEEVEELNPELPPAVEQPALDLKKLKKK